MSAPAPVAIALEHVGRTFGDVAALHDVTLEVRVGQTLCVVGRNGAGKTTLARIVAGLLRPSQGRVRVLGAELPAERHALRGRIGYVGHDAALYRALTARENARLRARLLGLPDASADRALAAAELGRHADRPVRELSRGLRQRAAVACALVGDPELLVLDEPFASLDRAASELVAGLVGPREGRTRLLVTHDLERAAREGNVVLVLADGRAHIADRAGRAPSAADLAEVLQ